MHDALRICGRLIFSSAGNATDVLMPRMAAVVRPQIVASLQTPGRSTSGFYPPGRREEEGLILALKLPSLLYHTHKRFRFIASWEAWEACRVRLPYDSIRGMEDNLGVGRVWTSYLVYDTAVVRSGFVSYTGSPSCTCPYSPTMPVVKVERCCCQYCCRSPAPLSTT